MSRIDPKFVELFTHLTTSLEYLMKYVSGRKLPVSNKNHPDLLRHLLIATGGLLQDAEVGWVLRRKTHEAYVRTSYISKTVRERERKKNALIGRV